MIRHSPRTLNGKTQTLDWDDEGHLAKVTNADGTSASYLYDAGGNRLLSRDASGTTLYLGDTEVRLAKGTTTTTGTRYYSWAGQTIAVRSSTGSLQWQVTDAHDTAETAVDATTQAITRRLDPFGNTRGTQPTATAWLGAKGFVAGVQDTTSGLTHLGAREYDPTIGRFVSDDPILELTDAQQIDGYTYAADNPVRGSDPSGLQMPVDQDCTSCAQADQKSTLVDTGSVNDSGTHHSGGGGGSHSGGASSHHSCGWSLSCHVSNVAHKAYHAVQQHPVIAAVVATAVVVGVVRLRRRDSRRMRSRAGGGRRGLHGRRRSGQSRRSSGSCVRGGGGRRRRCHRRVDGHRGGGSGSRRRGSRNSLCGQDGDRVGCQSSAGRGAVDCRFRRSWWHYTRRYCRAQERIGSGAWESWSQRQVPAEGSGPSCPRQLEPRHPGVGCQCPS
ncbi:RHS repeat-associated core domain-containing protein [Streptomyces sp. NPDC002755]|uniref:RHS repeat-associated core domain-containing protein n=1 Tax=Streptomyces sp. NPDC002884 TaxID=3154544 RepID=UPI00331D8350